MLKGMKPGLILALVVMSACATTDPCATAPDPVQCQQVQAEARATAPTWREILMQRIATGGGSSAQMQQWQVQQQALEQQQQNSQLQWQAQQQQNHQLQQMNQNLQMMNAQ
jgi:hypothetical protein